MVLVVSGLIGAICDVSADFPAPADRARWSCGAIVMLAREQPMGAVCAGRRMTPMVRR